MQTGNAVGGGAARTRGALSFILELVTGWLGPQEGVARVGHGDGNTQPALLSLIQIKNSTNRKLNEKTHKG